MPLVLRNKNILVISGDVSGDLHASNLIRELKRKEETLVVWSIGGVRSKEVSDRFLYDVVSKGVFGFVSSLKSLGLWIKLIGIVRRFLEEKKPAFVVAVDFFGFNRQVLGLCRNRSIPVYYYIPPQVWASRPKRALTVSANSKRIYAIFPFEVEIYRKLNGNVKYFGHPLSDLLPKIEKPRLYPSGDFKIGILPGSRRSEIESHLKVFVDVFKKLKEDLSHIEGYVFMVDEFDERYYRGIVGDGVGSIRFVRDRNYEIRKTMDFCLTSSGTATLENALCAIPMIVGYKTSFINYELAKAFVNIPYISLPNIILSREVVKEFIQYDFKPSKIYPYVKEILFSKERYEKISADLFEIRKLITSDRSVASSIADDIIGDFEIV